MSFVIEPLQDVMAHLRAMAPQILVAVLLVVIGLIVAALLRVWVKGLLNLIAKRLQGRAEVHKWSLGRVGHLGAPLVGRIVFWLVFLFFVAAALEQLNQPVVSGGLRALVAYLPQVLAAALIILAGYLLGQVARATVLRLSRTSHLAQGELLARLVHIAIVVTAILIGMDQLGLDINLLIIAVSIAGGAFAFGMALAFGMGAQQSVSNLIASHYVARSFRVGQTVRIGVLEGRIVAIRPTAILVDGPEGRAVIPARHFEEETVLIRPEGS